MTAEILIDVTPFEWRLALVVEDQVQRLAWHHPLSGGLSRGSLLRAQVAQIDNRLNAAFLKFPGGGAFLRRQGKLPAVGERVIVEVKREAIGDKEAEVTDRPVLRLPMVHLPMEAGPRPGPLLVGEDEVEAATEAASALGSAAMDGEALGPLAQLPPILPLLSGLLTPQVERICLTERTLREQIIPFLPEGFDVDLQEARAITPIIDAAVEDAMGRHVPLEGGGRLVIDETEALTAVDLDLGRGQGQSVKGAAERVLTAALARLGQSLAVRDIGGQIVVDIPRGAIKAPKIIRDRLIRSLKALGRVSIPAVTPEGIAVVIAPRHGPSLLDRVTSAAGSGVRPGRVWRAEVAAAQAYRAAEAALAADRSRNVALTISPRLADIWGEATAALTARYASRLKVTVMDQPPGEGPDHELA